MNDLTKLQGEDWAIETMRFKSLIRDLSRDVQDPAIKEKAAQNDYEIKTSWYGTQQPRVEIHGTVAVIPVYGTLAQNISPFLKFLGFVDYLDVARMIRKAAGEVNTIVLDFDTPGGTVTGARELRELIAKMEARGIAMVSFTNSMRASAGELVSSACSIVTATQSAVVGSIGTMIAFEDVSMMFEEYGISVEVFSSGDYKGMGTPGTSLNDTHRLYLQDRVEQLADEFKFLVQATGRDIADDFMQGQTFRGSEAEQIGLVDFVSDSLESLVAGLQSSSVD